MKSAPETPQSEVLSEIPAKKRKLFTVEERESEDDPLPYQYRHVRQSERIVRDDFYQTCANLSGEGLSLQESSSAIVMVANGMFGRHWKHFD